MSGIVFLLELVVFLMVAYWVCVHDRKGDPSVGLFGMKDADASRAAPDARRGPRWKGMGGDQPAARPTVAGSGPRWKRLQR